MKTIHLSERELSMIFSMLTPPYTVSDTHTDEFNELRNKVFYALRDAQNDEPVSNRDELQVIGWLRSDYNSDDKRDPNAPLFMLGSNDPSEAWGVKYLPLSGNSPVIPDGYVLVPIVPTEDMIINGFESVPDPHFSDEKEWEEYEALSGCRKAARRAELCWAAMISAVPKG
ncbi:hypothetical protein [Citrobacter koseri]|uniref:hypothetical protein n=1 Tax=Citrobacter koseri TaxID=545 RepID=UPI000DF10D56|nr:hypothetical protein [Citrobacter koseri]STB29458.1 Uncharacterised protein [Citrobacter koseri]